MTACKELVLDDMMAITAIPVGDIPAIDTSSIVNNITPTISASSFNPSLANAITIGRELLDLTVSGGDQNKSTYLVPIKRLSGKAKDEESDSVAGRLHTVNVTCEVDERGGEIWAPIGDNKPPCSLRLERTAHHLVLSFRDGTRAFVSASDDSYICTIDRDGAKVSVQFRIQNWMGIQMIVPSATAPSNQ